MRSTGREALPKSLVSWVDRVVHLPAMAFEIVRVAEDDVADWAWRHRQAGRAGNAVVKVAHFGLDDRGCTPTVVVFVICGMIG